MIYLYRPCLRLVVSVIRSAFPIGRPMDFQLRSREDATASERAAASLNETVVGAWAATAVFSLERRS